jgi:hypothetical protein
VQPQINAVKTHLANALLVMLNIPTRTVVLG